MKRKIVISMAALLMALFALGCASGAVNAAATETAAATDAAAATATTDSTMLELTLEELKQYDGKNGNPAYVAVDGVIYDMTNLKAWKDGEHNGYSAGNDLTDIIKNKSPHGVSKLKGVPIVGKLVDG